MPTITATKAGNWSDTTVWDLGRIPIAGDDVDLAGYAIEWDSSVSVIPITGTLKSIKSGSNNDSAGYINVNLNNFNTDGILNSLFIHGSSVATGIININGTSSYSLTINAGKLIDNDGIRGGSRNYSCGVYYNAQSPITINGDIIGGSSNDGGLGDDKGGYGVYASFQSNVFTIVGDIYGTEKYGVMIDNSSANFSITGNIYSTYGNSGVFNSGTMTNFTIIGNIIAGNTPGFRNQSGSGSITGIITGGNTISAYGVYNSDYHITLGAGTCLAQGIQAGSWWGPSPIWTSSLTNRARFYTGTEFGQAANTDFPQQIPAGDIKSGIVSGTITGTLFK